MEIVNNEERLVRLSRRASADTSLGDDVDACSEMLSGCQGNLGQPLTRVTNATVPS